MNKPLDKITAGTGIAPDTLPGYYYFDPAIYQQEKEKVFARTWQYIGHVSMFEEAPSYLVREIADESIIIVKNKEGGFSAFFNVCQHRAHRLLEGEGRLPPLITCPYHNWGYDHGGKLKVARGTEELSGFYKEKICLKDIRLEQWCGFIFINLDANAESLSSMCSELESELRSFSELPENLFLADRYTIPLKANWKNSMENFSECYHCPNQHPTLSQNALELETYKIECLDHYHVHRSRDKGDEMGYKTDSGKTAKPDEFRSFFIWPNTVIEVYPGGNVTVFHHVPDGPEGTVQGIEWYFHSKEMTPEDKAVVDFVHSVRLEDIPLCESVQKGLHSRGYDRGKLVIDADRSYMSEHGVYDFQQKLVKALES